MKIYVASLWQRMDEARAVAAVLEAAGHTIVSSWHAVENKGTKSAEKITDGPQAAEAAVRAEAAALKDMSEVLSADAIVVLAVPHKIPFTGGGHCTEFGMAAATGKRLYVLGNRSNIFYCLPQVIRYDSVHEIVDSIRAEVR